MFNVVSNLYTVVNKPIAVTDWMYGRLMYVDVRKCSVYTTGVRSGGGGQGAHASPPNFSTWGHRMAPVLLRHRHT